MSVELIAISSFVLAILGGLAHFIKSSNLKHLKICGCCQSDCQQNEDNTLKRIESNQAKIDKLTKKVNKLKIKRGDSSEPSSPSIGRVVFLTGEEEDGAVMI